MCYALQSSLCSIVCDEEVDNKQELMQESLTQFDATMSQAIAQWASGSTAKRNQKIIGTGIGGGTELHVVQQGTHRGYDCQS